MRVRQLQAGGVQQQALAGELLAEKLVVLAVAVGGVAQHVVGNVFHVAAQLVFAPGFGLQFQQRIAAAGVTVNGVRQFKRQQALVMGDGCLRGFVLVGVGIGDLVQFLFERMVDDAGFLRVAAHDGEVGFLHQPGAELFRQQAGGVAVERKQQYAGGGFVEAVYRENFLPDLVAGELDGEAGFMPVDQAAVYQQPGRFVDSDEVVVVVEDFQHACVTILSRCVLNDIINGNVWRRREYANNSSGTGQKRPRDL